jgi:hypothetical protein
MPGAVCARSLACDLRRAHELNSLRSHQIVPAFPARMVLTVSFVVSPETGLCCLRHLADTSARLDTSVGVSGRYDFAVRLGAIVTSTFASTASRSASVTIASRPS